MSIFLSPRSPLMPDPSFLPGADDSEDRPGEIEFHKNEQLKKQKEGKGHWTPELSSNSEAAVRRCCDPLVFFR